MQPLSLKDSLFDPTFSNEDREILFYKGEDGKKRYKVWIYLEGPQVYYVDYVIYYLHETFSPREKKVPRLMSNSNCSLAIWTWGVFNVRATAYFKTGEIISLEHFLTFDKEISKKSAKFRDTKGSIE